LKIFLCQPLADSSIITLHRLILHILSCKTDVCKLLCVKRHHPWNPRLYHSAFSQAKPPLITSPSLFSVVALGINSLTCHFLHLEIHHISLSFINQLCAMKELYDFLCSLHLEQYYCAFLNRGVDTFDALARLEWSQFEQLNMKRGHFRLLQSALGNVRCGHSLNRHPRQGSEQKVPRYSLH
jgi:hypothetical protein